VKESAGRGKEREIFASIRGKKRGECNQKGIIPSEKGEEKTAASSGGGEKGRKYEKSRSSGKVW